MQRILPFLALAAMGSECDVTGAPSDPFTLDDGCGEGLTSSLGSNLVIRTFLVDNISLVTEFDTNASYDGVPAACVTDSGFSGILQFEANGGVFGSLDLSAPQTGTFDMVSDDVALTVDLFGSDDPVVFTPDDWTDGSWFVTGEFASNIIEVEGSATTTGGRTLVIAAEAELAP